MSDVMEIGSIEELAELFEQRAKAARDRIGPQTPNMRIALQYLILNHFFWAGFHETAIVIHGLPASCRRPRRERRATHAHAPGRILPQLLGGVQVPERARNGLEIITGEFLRNVRVIARLRVDER
jgi:hypothetical protein